MAPYVSQEDDGVSEGVADPEEEVEEEEEATDDVRDTCGLRSS